LDFRDSRFPQVPPGPTRYALGIPKESEEDSVEAQEALGIPKESEKYSMEAQEALGIPKESEEDSVEAP